MKTESSKSLDHFPQNNYGLIIVSEIIDQKQKFDLFQGAGYLTPGVLDLSVVPNNFTGYI